MSLLCLAVLMAPASTEWEGGQVLGCRKLSLQGRPLGTSLHVLHSVTVLRRIQGHKEHFWAPACCCLEWGLPLVLEKSWRARLEVSWLPQALVSVLPSRLPSVLQNDFPRLYTTSTRNFDLGTTEGVKTSQINRGCSAEHGWT